jgi:hypothetical protein
MENHFTDCMICAQPLVYTTNAQSMACVVCGAAHKTNAACIAGHFICDECHAKSGIVEITAYALNTDSKNPVEIAQGMMRKPAIHMHGPEHHFLVPAALLAAYAQAGGRIDLPKALQIARQRAGNVPGGACGLWGCCGAAVGAGIFISIITDATVFSGKEWSISNLATSQALAEIAKHNGPRCCKRDVFIAILTMIGFVAEHFGIEMEKPSNTICDFFVNNKQCLEGDCPFYPSV